ncbi:MAG: hypothetical protein ACHP9Z_14510 [Streptosporangiales bacterium]
MSARARHEASLLILAVLARLEAVFTATTQGEMTQITQDLPA